MDTRRMAAGKLSELKDGDLLPFNGEAFLYPRGDI